MGSVSFADNIGNCTMIAKKKVANEIRIHYPRLSGLKPEIFIDTPDDLDKLPENAIKIYVSYGCKTASPVSYLVVGLLSSSTDSCDVDYVWDTGKANAGILCEESR